MVNKIRFYYVRAFVRRVVSVNGITIVMFAKYDAVIYDDCSMPSRLIRCLFLSYRVSPDESMST